MGRTMRHALTLVALGGLVTTLPALAGDEVRTRVEGQVVAVAQETVPGTTEAQNVYTVRLRNGEQVRLRLAASNAGAGFCQVGDPIRARVRQLDQQQATYRVRTMQNLRTGDKVRQRDRTRDQDRLRANDRIQTGSQDRLGDRRGGAGGGSERGRSGRGGRS